MEKLLASIINNGIELNKNNDNYMLNKETNVKFYLRDYQKLAADFFLQPNINSFFLYWEPGFGKTLAAIYILKHLTNIWPNWNYVIFVKSQLIDEPWMTSINAFIPELKRKIIFISYDKHTLSGNDIINKLKRLNSENRTFFIIDEVHNLIKLLFTKDGIADKRLVRNNFFTNLLKILRQGKNKLLILTATPIHNSIQELPYFLKLLRPNNFKTDDIFFSNEQIINYKGLRQCILGAASVQRNHDVDIFTNTLPKNNLAGRRIIISKLIMSDFQSSEYVTMHNIEKASSVRGLRPFTRSISTFAVPTSKKNFDSVNAYNQHINNEYDNFMRNILDITFSDEDINDFRNGNLAGAPLSILINLGIENPKEPVNADLIEKITILNKYSCKYIKTCHLLLNAHGKCLHYEPFVKFTGIKTIKPYLDKFKLTYIEYTGNTINTRTALLEEFNDPKNLYGEFIETCIFSSAGEEGLNYTNIESIIISSPPWSTAKLAQIIGRAIRLYSHSMIDEIKRLVNIYMLLAYTNDEKLSVDDEIYKLLQKKEASTISTYKIFKDASIESIHNAFPFEANESDDLFMNFTNMEYKIEKPKKQLIINKEFKKINYSLDKTFSHIYVGLKDDQNKVFSEEMLYIGEIIFENNKPVFKIINNNLVYLVYVNKSSIEELDKDADQPLIDIPLNNFKNNSFKETSLQDYGFEISVEN